MLVYRDRNKPYFLVLRASPTYSLKMDHNISILGVILKFFKSKLQLNLQQIPKIWIAIHLNWAKIRIPIHLNGLDLDLILGSHIVSAKNLTKIARFGFGSGNAENRDSCLDISWRQFSLLNSQFLVLGVFYDVSWRCSHSSVLCFMSATQYRYRRIL